MKKFTFFFFLILISVCTVFAQVPSAFNYQAVVRNSSGELVSNQNVSFRISILEDSESGITVYSETHSATTNNFGLVSLKVGQGTSETGTFSPDSWGAIPHFIKIELDAEGGNTYTHMGTSQLLSVPYAFHAQTVEVDKVDDADADATNELQTISLSGTLLTLSDGGGTVTLPSSGGGDNWGTQTVISDATLSGDGTTASPLSIDGGLIDNQTLAISGNDLSISGGNTVTLPTGSVSPWTSSTAGINYFGGKVGINHDPADDSGALQIWGDGLISLEAVSSSSTFPTIYAQNNTGTAVYLDGQIVIKDGTEGAGKVLTSDANGLASWAASSFGTWTQDGDDIYYTSGNVGIGAAPTFDLDIINTADNAIVRISAPNNNGNLVIDRANQNYYARVDYRNADASGTFTTGLYRGSSNFRIDATLSTELVGLEVETDGDILVSNEVHQKNTGTANMLPFAYGYITSAGNLSYGTSNISMASRLSTGQYKIEIDNLGSGCVIQVTGSGGSSYILTKLMGMNTSYFTVSTWDTKLDAYSDCDFSFVVYKL
ncbi:autotransporter outer membrane beta-barrel domain-containing protein [Maribellus maritimus]|uniref:hypothetical protein n=1 Tax=Maribellus maritimus TaxID=2870838 RepID=UPI001EECA9CE|nr:hypothetical protein [Maribellus maritimus]MCG6190377.1 hypothetical protein [Maribellus maritimus]